MLIIFVDALPYYRFSAYKQLTGLFEYHKALRPGFGYSVNLHAELFAGKRPDDVDYFGEWAFNGFAPLSYRQRTLAILEERLGAVARIFRLVANRIFRTGIAYIPFRLLPMFEKRGVYPLVTKNRVNSILDQYVFSEHIADRVRAPLGKKDEQVFLTAMAAINAAEKNIFISMCDLDGMFHEYGTQSELIEDRYEQLGIWISELIENYSVRYPGEPYVLLSDHGIADVDTTVTLDLAPFHDLVMSGDLVYFYDSLYLQIWLKEPACRQLEQICEHIINSTGAYRISNEERIEEGVANNKFGDVIFVLPEGVGFSPNFFGFRTLRSYHGYHPSYESSHGVAASNRDLSMINRNVDVFEFLKEKIELG